MLQDKDPSASNSARRSMKRNTPPTSSSTQKRVKMSANWEVKDLQPEKMDHEDAAPNIEEIVTESLKKGSGLPNPVEPTPSVAVKLEVDKEFEQEQSMCLIFIILSFLIN